ncbi:MAG: ribonuclease III [Melioribacteraceae bacterium]|nr:ribonuclease III [Melioribacteraceae bacterium]
MLGQIFTRIKSVFFKQKTINQEKKLERIIEEKTAQLEKFFDFSINDPTYFVKALTHRSYLELIPQLNKSNERLEFLGDSVLGLIVSQHLFLTFEDKEEGFLTKYRSLMVNRDALAKAAAAMGLQNFILYDSRFVNGSSTGLNTILADALEAIIGAIYLDQGFNTTKDIVYKWIIEPNTLDGELPADRNFKGKLLEYAHSQGFSSPVYNVIKEEGPEHDKEFTVSVLIDGDTFGAGIGKSKKTAEQNAAKNALDKLNQ